MSQVAADYLIVALAPGIAGRVHCLDASSKIGVLNHFKESFEIGQPVQCRILKVRDEAHTHTSLLHAFKILLTLISFLCILKCFWRHRQDKCHFSEDDNPVKHTDTLLARQQTCVQSLDVLLCSA